MYIKRYNPCITKFKFVENKNLWHYVTPISSINNSI